MDAVYQRIRQKVHTVGPSPFYLYRQSIMFSQKRSYQSKSKKPPKTKNRRSQRAILSLLLSPGVFAKRNEKKALISRHERGMAQDRTDI